MSVTVSTPPALGPITVLGNGMTAPVQVVIPGRPQPPMVTLPPPLAPPVVQLPGADLSVASVPEYADYPAQTIQERLEQLIDLKAERVFRGVERFVLTQDGAQEITLAQRVIPGTLEVYYYGIRQFELDDVPNDGQTFQFPEDWGLYAGDPLAFVYNFLPPEEAIMAVTKASAARILLASSITLGLLSPTIAIPDTYLASGTDLIKRTGSVPYTANQPMGGNILTGLGNGVASGDSVNFAQLMSVFNGTPFLGGADTVSLVNVASKTGYTTHNGYTLADLDIIQLNGQTTGSENGPWQVPAGGGVWVRPAWYAAAATIREGSEIVIERGTFAGYSYVLTTQGGATVGTTSTSWLGLPYATAYTQGSGILISSNAISVKNGNGLTFDGSQNLTLNLNGGTLNLSGAGLKITDGAPGQVLLGFTTTGVATWTTLSGDVLSVSGAGVLTLVANIMRASYFVNEETPSGSANDSNVTFGLANTPVAGTVALYVGGVRQKFGAGNDYTISGTTITMATAPASGENIVADYRKTA